MPIALPTEQKKLAAFVDRRHPDYAGRLAHWKFCISTYEGGRDWFDANIHTYLKEGDTEFTQRRERAYRFNHTKEVVSLVTKYIFKEGVIRNKADAKESLKKFWEQAMLDGLPIDVLMRRISDKSSITGRVWAIVDNLASPQEVQSVADEKTQNARIYAYLIDQTDMLDFSRDQWGKLNWVLYRIPSRDDDDPINSTGKVVPRYMLWTREEWILLEEREVVAKSVREPEKRQIVVINRGENAIGEVPAFPIDHLENEALYSPSGLIDDTAYLDRAVANYLSNLDAIIQDQTFSQLAMPAQGLMPGEDAYGKLVEMGTKRIFLYDGESQRSPEYLTPDAAQAILIVSVVKMIIGEIYHSIGMAGERTKQDNAMGIDNSSGVAKAYDFDRMNALLCAKADMLQRAENRIAYFVGRWSGDIKMLAEETPAESLDTMGLIKYPDNYDVRGLPDEFEIAQNLQLLDAPDEIRRQQMTVLVEKLYPRLAKDLKDKIIEALKEWPTDLVMQATDTLSSVSKLGDVIGNIQSPPTGGGATKPASKKTQGQNPGKSKTLPAKS